MIKIEFKNKTSAELAIRKIISETATKTEQALSWISILENITLKVENNGNLSENDLGNESKT